MELQLPLQASFTTTISFQLSSVHCGVFSVRLKSCKIADYLRLFSASVKSAERTKQIAFEVLPAAEEHLQQFHFHEATSGEQETAYDPYHPGEDASEVFGIREFRDGDTPKRIHWKRSTRGETLFVKEYSLPLQKNHLLFLNGFLADTESREPQQASLALDTILECAYNISRILLQQQASFCIAYCSKEQEFVSTEIRNPADIQNAIIQFMKSGWNTASVNGSQLSAFLRNQNAAYLFLFTATIPQDWHSMLSSAAKTIFLTMEQTALTAASKEAVIPMQTSSMSETLSMVCSV